MSTPNSVPTNLVQPYLNFDGRCEEAIEFYKQALGAEVQFLLRFKDSPEPPQPGCMTPGTENKIMHMSLKIGNSTIMGSDCRCSGQQKIEGISLALSLPDEATVGRAFAALSEGGEVGMPLAKTFFSPSFGVVTDRFGVSWMVMATTQPA